MERLWMCSTSTAPLRATPLTQLRATPQADTDAETARVLAGARSWFTAFDDARELALIVAHVRRQHESALEPMPIG
jgi:hypothetical protein